MTRPSEKYSFQTKGRCQCLVYYYRGHLEEFQIQELPTHQPYSNFFTSSLHKKRCQRQVGVLKNFIAAPLIILLHGYQIFPKSHPKRNRMLPIRFKKEPHYKVLEAHLPADRMQR